MFKREKRYFVLKWSDVQESLTVEEQSRLQVLAGKVDGYRGMAGKSPLDVFVLEADWAEFPIAIDMVRRRMEGLPTREAEYLAPAKEFKEAVSEILRVPLGGNISDHCTALMEKIGQQDDTLRLLREIVVCEEGDNIVERAMELADYKTKADAIIRDQKEKLERAVNLIKDIHQLGTDSPELNMSNYSHDDVNLLNEAMVGVWELSKDYLYPVDTCGTCGGSGSVGGVSGQTPESYSEETYPCPDCQKESAPEKDWRDFDRTLAPKQDIHHFIPKAAVVPPKDMTLVVESAMTEDEKAAFLTTFTKRNPGWRGAHVADVLDNLDDYDCHLDIIEDLHEDHGAEIITPRLFRLSIYAVIYISGTPEAANWEAVKAFAVRIEQ